VAQKNEVQGEEPRRTKIFREWKGVNTQASRLSIPQDAFYNLENIIPIGAGNCHTVPNISAALFDYTADQPYWMQFATINGIDYLIVFGNTGKVFAYNIVGGTSAQINAGHLLSGANSRMDQWKNSVILFIDSTGYYSWDGATFAPITGAGVPSYGDDIAVYSGRVWIAQGRVITVSGANDYSAASFTVANGAASVNLTDPQIRGNGIVRLLSANGYLYIFARSSINIISDVYVPVDSTGAAIVPQTPVFTNLNVQAMIGTDHPGSVFAFGRDIMFANHYGAYILRGITATRLSTDIDGTWQYINKSGTADLSGGAATVQNILNACFLFQRLNDPVFGSNTVVACWFDGKWWFTNYGSLTFITQALVGNVPQLFGFIANKLYQLHADNTTAPNTVWSTALWPMDDPLADKQVLRAGFEVTSSLLSSQSNFTLTVDTPTGSVSAPTINQIGFVSWINNTGAIVQWVNNVSAVVNWFNIGYTLYNSSSPSGFSKYVGLTGTAVGANYELQSISMDYKLRARWV